MDCLIDKNGKINFGLIAEPVDRINVEDFPLRTPMGRPRSRLLKRMLFKQFSFVGVDCPEIMAGLAVVDLKYAANAFFYVFDKSTRILDETKKTTAPWASSIIPSPDKGAAVFKASGLYIRIGGGRVVARCRDAEIDATLLFDRARPLRICTRTGYSGWTYTQKTAPIPVSGFLRVKGRTCRLSSDICMAITDWTAGYFRRNTYWYWAAAATVLPDGRRFGMNFSCGVNETEATENVFWIDGLQVKVDNVKFQYNPEKWEDEWHIMSADGKVELTFTPVSFRKEHLNFRVVASRFTQFMGLFSGRLKDPAVGDVLLEKCPGWAEDHFARW